MRPNAPRRLRNVRDDEDGAVVAIVAISLICLLGMLVLTFDLGRSVAIKRQMVSGADAAALAAAQECAMGHGLDSARAAAASILDDNVSGSTVGTFSAPQCNSPSTRADKQVTVTASTDVDYFFAPIFGISSGTVEAGATAAWGPTPIANPIPITVDLNQLVACGIPTDNLPPDATIPCDLAYPKDALEEPRWGILDLDHWNEPDAAPCHVDAATLANLIENGGWPEPLPLNDDGASATYDCLDNGLTFSAWADLEGRILTFPVIDIPNSYGSGCTGEDPACKIDTADIVQFVTLRVITAVNDGSTVRLQVEWLGPDTVPDGTIGSGLDFGRRAIRLVK
jgi:Flp pilus assembly protein TadG